MMKNKFLLRSIVIAALMIVTSLSVLASTGSPVDQPQRASTNALTPHATIIINGNEDFAVQGWPGNGTASEPYIIDGLDIDATAAIGIDIQNADAYFTVTGCYIHDGGSGYIGIYLYNCMNGNLNNNTCSNDMVGIYLESSDGITVSNNTCTGNYYAMYLYDSDGNTVSGNNCDTNSDCGIYLESSSSNTIIDNLCSSDNYGIYLTIYDVDPSDLNTLSNNTCHYNFNGIFLEWTGNNTLIENNCTESDYGIALLESDGNTLSYNNCSLDSECGIYLEASNENILSGSNCSENYYGIYATGSDNLTITDNNVNNNTIDGIYVEFSNYIALTDNICNDNEGDAGIWTTDVDNVTAIGNTCNSQPYGLYVDTLRNCTIINNICNDNDEEGLFVGIGDSRNGVITNNVCNNNYEGIYLDNFKNCSVSNNICLGNTYGIYLQSSSNISMINNTCSNNFAEGMYLTSSSNNMVWNNVFTDNNGGGIQAYDDGTDNHWNTSGIPNGHGNWWSDWKTPDDVAPWGIVDNPYILGGGGGGTDYYPRTSPSVTIGSPTNASTYFTNWGWIKLTGTAYDDTAVTNVTWSNSLGGSGTAYGTASWQTRGNVQLFAGENVITVTAHNAVGDTGSDTLTITYETVLPTCTITSPTSSPTHVTNLATIDLAGSASDSSGIAAVTWKNVATGTTGTASDTDSWSITGIALNLGMNLIYVNATDNAGNKGSDAIWVIYSIDTLAVTITAPTADPTMTTGWHMIYLRGTASDDVKVTNVVWSNSLGGSGIAYMTPQWGASSVNWQSRGNVLLSPGDNVITVTAYDSAGNSATDVLTVTYTGL